MGAIEYTNTDNGNENCLDRDRCNVKVRGLLMTTPKMLVDRANYTIYEAKLRVTRLSGAYDDIDMNIKKEIVESVEELVGEDVIVDGTLRTYKCADGSSKTNLLVYSIHEVPESAEEHINEVELHGKIVSLRNTKSKDGTDICEARIEIKGRYNKMSRVTAVGWGGVASRLQDIGVGGTVFAEGRVQSHEMLMQNDGKKSALEVAVSFLH